MIKRKEEMPVETSCAVRGGSGVVHIIDMLGDPELFHMGRQFCVTVVEPGAYTGKHFHIGDFETYYIIKGTALFNDNGTTYELRAGDVAQCKSGNYHAIKNIGSDDLEYVALILYDQKTSPQAVPGINSTSL